MMGVQNTSLSLLHELNQEISTYFLPEHVDLVTKAYYFAENAHQGQKRFSGEAYITHPLAVAQILATMHLDHETIIAALLHDTIEDTGIEKNQLVELFGERIAELVDGVSKLTKISFETRAEAQAENFRKMLLAMAQDLRVILIKLADRLHNMRTLDVLPIYKQQRIARETLDIYAPIANRLGMHKYLIEFEDRSFATIYPLRYKALKNAVKKAKGNRKGIMTEIGNTLKGCIEKLGIEHFSVKGREKHLYSIYKKMRAKRASFAEIMDVYAFRIVVPDIDTCYRILGVVHQFYKPVPERFKDYIAIPKANNYQSLHTILFGPYGVPIEIQIRTKEMDQIAENGIASHWIYKSGTIKEEAPLHARTWLKNLLEMQESTKSPLEFIENVKIDLFPDEVYVFTPKGDIMELPAGATTVDFAYAVHSDIGNSCIAAKINRRLAPLSTALANGQTVEIITAPGARPNKTWLEFVVTGKARSNIKHYLKVLRRTESAALGKQLLEKALAAFGCTLQDISETKIKNYLAEHKYKTINKLMEAVGLGNRLPIVVAKALTESIENIVKNEKNQSTQPLLIKGSQGVLVSFAECCHPIPGDPIIGIFSHGEGLIIHVDQCKVVVRMRQHPERCIDVQWEDKVSGEFKVDLNMEVSNQRGVLARMATTIAAAEANIEDISIVSHQGAFMTIKLTLAVQNRDHLARTMRRLRSIKEVIKITRTKQE